MRAQIESTTKIVTVNGVPARIWEGTSEAGIPCHFYITRVAVKNDADQSEFERELAEQRAPSSEVAGIPLRLVL